MISADHIAGARRLVDTDPALAHAIDATFDRWPVPGLAAVVVRAGQMSTHVRGVRSADAPEAVDETTLFDVCSIGKAFTALALAQAEVEGLLSLDDPVGKHLPSWCLNDPGLTREVRLRDLLSHRVGLEDSLPAEAGLAGCIGADGLIARLHGQPSRWPLRHGFIYANTNYAAATAVLQHAVGPLPDRLGPLVQRLGMKHTHFSATRFHSDPQHARWHVGSGELGPLAKEPVWEGDQGIGNTYSCAADLGHWLQFLIGSAPDPGDGWRAALQSCIQPHVLLGAARRLSQCSPHAVLCAYGLGWAVSDLKGHRVLMHGGEMPGTRAWIAWAPHSGVGVAVLANASRPLPWAVGHLALHHLLGQPAEDWVQRAQHAAGAEHDRWSNAHTAAARAAYDTGGALAAGPGRWTQTVAGAVRIDAAGAALALRFDDVPFWNGTLKTDGLWSRVRFDDPAAHDIFGGLEPPIWQLPNGELQIADFGPFTPV